MASPHQVVEHSSTLPVSAEEAFACHERPGAFERLTPPWERITVEQRTGGIREGARTAVRVRVGPAKLRWVAVHREYVEGRRFVDEQVEGPFSHWRHEHRFEPLGADMSRCTDRVELSPPLGRLGATASPWLVLPRIERMLKYRHATLRDDLAAHARHRDRPPLHVAVTGATGLLGSSLVPLLTTGGHRVSPVTRRRNVAGAIHWDPAAGLIDAAALEGVDAVVHLAGENVGSRWTDHRKRRIRDSRVEGTMLLAEALAALKRPPRVLVSASGVGSYGNRGDEVLTEEAIPEGAPTDFFVELGRDWEGATHPASAAGIRVVILRLGIVLTPAGGALGRMLPPFRLGVGGPLGSGKQWVSWISIDDAIGAFHHALVTESLAGATNAAAPEPVTSRTFAATLGRVLKRPAVLPAPAPVLKLLFGEMADTALLAGQRLSSARLVGSGYTFRHPTLDVALRHVLGRGDT